MSYISKKTALEILDSLISRCHSIGSPEKFKEHFVSSADIAEEIAKKIGEDPETLWYGGFSHEIGRLPAKDQ